MRKAENNRAFKKAIKKAHVPTVVPSFSMLFSDIGDATTMISGDHTDVTNWNNFFNLPTYGTEFTSCIIDGNRVKLYGGANISLQSNIFGSYDPTGTSLIEVIDEIGCIVELNQAVFSKWGSSGNGCKGLTTVHLPACSSMYPGVFHGCIALYDLVLDFENITRIEPYMFYGCTSLPKCYYPNLTYIDDYAFWGNTSLVDPDFSKVTYVAERAFVNCTNLTTPDFTLLDDTGDRSFVGCSKLVSEFPNLTASWDYAFYGCGFINGEFPKLVVGYAAMFMWCDDMVSINCPLLEQINGSDQGMFANCTLLERLEIPLCTNITGNSTFMSCTSLEYLDLSSCVQLGDSTDNERSFSGIIGKTLTIKIPHALESDGDIVWLKANNTVTVLYSD